LEREKNNIYKYNGENNREFDIVYVKNEFAKIEKVSVFYLFWRERK
jgi:hypothetical protein